MRSRVSARRRTTKTTVAVLLALGSSGSAAQAQGPTADFPTAFARAFAGVEACVVLRDVAAGAQPASSNEGGCAERLPPCAIFEIAATVVALDRGLVPDPDAPVRRDPPPGAEPRPNEPGVTLRDAFRRGSPEPFGELARRVGPDAFAKSLQALRYGNADPGGAPIERMWLGEDDAGVRISVVEQVDFLARLKRGELPTSAESQARTVEVIPFERTPDGLIAWKSGQCGPAYGPKVAWAAGWVDRGQRTTVFAAAERGPEGVTGEDAVGRMRALLRDLALAPQAPR